MAGTTHQRDSLATCWPPHSIFTATGGLRCAESRVYKRDPALPGFGNECAPPVARSHSDPMSSDTR